MVAPGNLLTVDRHVLHQNKTILKRSLLLLGTPEEGITGLSEKQLTIKKRFYGLEMAVEDVSLKFLQDF
jgi:hypothetical protein